MPDSAISASTLDHQRQEVLDQGFDAFIGKPFAFEEVCACLAQLLGVEYLYADEAAEDEGAAADSDWSMVKLPAQLRSRLKQATELGIVTQMEDHFKEMEAMGESAGRLAAHLRQLRQQLDLEGVLRILEDIDHA